MNVQEFLAHHGVGENPFGQEDAQSDHVFKDHCLDSIHHPAWDKIYGRPDEPSTSVVFGEKGSGKTALRLQITKLLHQHNEQHEEGRVFVIEYDDFNPFLDCFRERLHGRKRRPEKALARWRLWDHMDAILSLGINRLVHGVLDSDADSQHSLPTIDRQRLKRLSHLQKRDLLLLCAFYHHTYDEPPRKRWSRLKRKLGYPTWKSHWDWILGVGVSLLTATALLKWSESVTDLFQWWIWVIVAVGWFPRLWRQAGLMWKSWRISKQIRVFDHMPNTLRKILSRFPGQELAGQPAPSKDRSDDRYELLAKFQSILKTLGYDSIVVLVDRVDEPHMINGSAERMRDLLWPMFDNKFLKHPGMGFKLLLPIEVVFYLNREKKEFYERSRLDKQNLITSLEWTGESLYDVANSRMQACAQTDGKSVSVCDLFEDSIDSSELIAIFARLRVPRHLFKFLYRTLVDHCNRFTDENPQWKIDRETLQSTLAVYTRDLEAFDRGMGAG